MSILNFGSMNLDYVYQVEHFVRPGETLSAVSQKVNPGGKGLNQSIALAKAGATVFHAGCLGQGGESLGKLLQNSGVDIRFLRLTEELQGNAIIQVAPDGQNCILLFGGSNQCVTDEQVTETLSHFSEGDYLVLQNEINNLPLIVDEAFQRGMKIILNPSPCNDKLQKVDFGKIHWLMVNEVEAEQLSGSGRAEEAWRLLHEKYPRINLLVTLGSEGSIAFTGEEMLRQAAFPVRAVDTTAAGDTFTGYFVAGLAAGHCLQDSMRQAAMASSVSVTRPGAASSIPSLEEVRLELERRV